VRCILCLALLVTDLAAQEWNTPEALDLVGRAVRARQTGTAPPQYVGHARGMVLFLVQPGEREPALARADQLAVEVYWQAPDRSKQNIAAWRHRRWMPTGIQYHRDHLGIVPGDFGDAIRIGEGDEVLDVPHPLSPAGPALYDFAAGASLRIRGPRGELRVREVLVRPKDDEAPRVAGSLYFETGSAALVRFRFGFTRSAYLQAELEDISVVLENALFEDRWWLPWRQEISIRRRASWFDFPIRSIILGRWEIGDYDFSASFPPDIFAGGPYGGLRLPDPARGAWEDTLEDLARQILGRSLRTDLDLVPREVTRLIGGAALARRPARPAFGAISDLALVNRVQGLALGLGLNVTLRGAGVEISPRLGYGTADRRVTGSGDVRLTRDNWGVSFRATSGLYDIAERPIISRLLNSVVSLAEGNDHGDWVRLRRAEAGGLWRARQNLVLRGRVAHERTTSVETASRPLSGTYRPNPPLGAGDNTLGGVSAALGEADGPGSGLWGDLEAGSSGGGYFRASGHGRLESRVSGGVFVATLAVGTATANTPPWRTFTQGGRGTLPGEPYRAFGGRWQGLGRVEWQIMGGPVPGAWVVSPFLVAGAVGGPLPGLSWGPTDGVRPVVGVASELLFRTVRIELGWAPRSGGWGVTFDASPLWWPIL
jgi:hypothetical protein